ncbi:MAG: helix-turn-helix transcriptional regulator [Pirellulaceae bacterium]
MTKQATKKRRQPKPPTATEPPQLGSRLRELRKAKQLTLRQLADRVDVGFTYLSKIENGKLEADCPSDQLITRMAEELDADEIELLLLAEKIPDQSARHSSNAPKPSHFWQS